MRTALIPGSFDPVTVGHLDVIRRAANGFDRVIVAVMTNDMQNYVQGAPRKHYMFTMQERHDMMVCACAEWKNVEVVSAGGRLIDLVDALGVDWIVKGVRNAEDFAYEQKHALYNRAHNERAETLYLPADPAFDHVSSTLVRAKLLCGESVSDYLSLPVIKWLKENRNITNKGGF